MVASGALGLALDQAIDNTGIADTIAGVLADALFDGLYALGEVYQNFMNNVQNGLNAIGGYQPTGIIEFEIGTDGQYGNFDGFTENGSEYNITLFNVSGFNQDYVISTNSDFRRPAFWNNTGPGPKEPPRVDDEEPPRAMIENQPSEDYTPMYESRMVGLEMTTFIQ